MYKKNEFRVGDVIEFVYNGKARKGSVEEIPAYGEWIRVELKEGFKTFSLHKLHDVKHIALGV